MTSDQAQQFSALPWVRSLVEDSLREARRVLEDHVDGLDSDVGMSRCVELLHQVNGALMVAQAHGAAMLADELEQVARGLADGSIARHNEAAEVLMLGMVQLPGYLERVESGQPDIPLILMPLLNDLRAARDAPLVSEISLFAPKLDQLIASEQVQPGSGNAQLPEQIRARRGAYLKALLGWYRSDDANGPLRDLRDQVSALSSQAGTARLRRLLDAADALLVAVGEQTVEPSIALKLLYGRLDRLLKRILDQGEETAVREFPADLLKNLLYYVSRSGSDNPVVEAVRQSADLANSFPMSEADLEAGADAGLMGPGKDLFAAVADALRTDLTAIKDDLDLYIRGDRAELDRLAGLAAPLQKVADTLGMVGRGDLRTPLKAHSDRLRDLDPAQLPDDDLLMAMAADLLRVESALSGLTPPAAQEEGAEAPVQSLSEAEMGRHQASAIQEAFVELAKVKESVGQFLKNPVNPEPLGDVPARLHGVSGVLRILQQGEAATQLDRLGSYLRAVSDGETEAPDLAARETLADVLTGVEYYLEAVVEERPNRQEILDFAREAAERLGAGVAGLAEIVSIAEAAPAEAAAEAAQEAEPAEQAEAPEQAIEAEVPEQPAGATAPEQAVEAPSTEEVVEPDRGEPPQAEPVAAEHEAPEPAEPAATVAEAPAMPETPERTAESAAAAPLPEDIDDEILEVFIEEAREELDNIAEQYPRWKSDWEDKQALQTLRRSFHTLKGSGRLVGASTIGEFAWSVENLLNRVIDGGVPPGSELFALLDEVTAALPALVAAQEQGGQPGIDVAPLEARAFAMAEGRQAPPPLPEAPVEAEPVAPESAAAAEPESPPEAPEPAAEQPAAAGLEIELPAETAAAEPDSESPGDTAAAEPPAEPEPEAQAETEAEAAAAAELEVELEAGPVSEPAAAIPDDAPLKLDPVLLEIFRNESGAHLDSLQRFIAQAKDRPAGSSFDEELRRALHTLRGSAHMAEVEPVATVAGRLEDLVNLYNQRGQRTDSRSLALLERAHGCVRDIVDAINVGGAALPDWSTLADEIAQRIEDAEAAEESQFVDSIDEASMELETEVLEIFSEEARELLERSEQEWDAWRANPADNQPVAELQRILHTLKGGARLAGVVTVGNLTHAMESLFETVADGRVSTTPGLQRLVRTALDRVNTAVELLGEGKVPSAEPALIERLEGAARGEWLEEPSTLLQSEMRVFEPPSAETPDEPEMVELLAEDELEEVVSSDDLEDDFSSELIESVDDSTLLTDSNLLTDSELLDDSQLSSQPAAESAAGEQGRIIPFPGSERRGEGGGEGLVERIPLPGPEPEQPAATQERIRVAAETLDQMVNNAGEVSIYRARLEQQNTLLGFNLDELDQTVARLRNQLRQLDLETEVQILSRHEREYDGVRDADFDPLEMDQYSNIQQLSRALVETVADLNSIGAAMGDLNRDSDTLLLQQSRVTNELQESLLRTRMLPFGSRAARLQRVVRQAAQDLGKMAELEVAGASGEMDRSILDRMMGPLEHLLRNAVAHGVEEPAERVAIGKPEAGRITLTLARDGADVVLEVQDDGAGMDRDAIRERAIERGLLDPQAEFEDDELYQFVLQPGFTTATEVSQVAGRGVGMDAVLSEIKQLGGSLDIHSEPGAGTRFTIRLPFTLAIAQTLLVTVADDAYAVPHTNVDALVRVSRRDLEEAYTGRQPNIEYAGHSYLVRHLGTVLGNANLMLPEDQPWMPVLLIRSGEHRAAIHVDSVIGNRQIVVKPLGTQLSTVRWFTGGTILADGRVALILDTTALARTDVVAPAAAEAEAAKAAEPTPGVTVMVVDDSITVRKVTSRLLERHNMHVLTAKDGVEAVAMLQEHHPDLMLLDIEMPRMDGFELARHMQNNNELNDIPIIMITSRTGDKHRNRAMELGVRSYLGKPYQESELLDNIYTLLAEHPA